MRILFSGDVAWNTGREALAIALPVIRREYGNFDFTLINCENAAHGKGMTDKIFSEFIALGVDAMTSGNHIWDKPMFFTTLDAETRVFRPANYPPSCPGRGHGIIERKGKKLGILNLEGQVFLPPIDSPFMCADTLIDELRSQGGENLPIFVDFHAEATSEKQAMGYWLDGRVSAVVGTHTHVQTADERIMPHGTAYISDAGMTGGHEGILGVSYESVMPKFIHGLPCKFEASESGAAFNGVIIEVDEVSGLAVKIERVQIDTGELSQ
ncbi:MAG: TIGR00282 family metallophosphoesterase [Synergistaceae bacterium]|nr:TIGR00282 family metallophosphoesterase [Synergistaceae bacterium]MBR0256188.1 TIGR00282 family metallophosphoesterase [Synergistaceae bacterium]